MNYLQAIEKNSEDKKEAEKILDNCLKKLDSVLPKYCPECGAVNCGIECYAEDEST